MNDLPIACSLSGAEQRGRALTARTLVAEAMLGWRATRRGISIRFAGESEPRLRELIAAESLCCPFLEFDLHREGSELQVEVEGPDLARPIILEVFGLDPEQDQSV